MNLPSMRANVRRDLHDEDPDNYRWTDDVLDRHIGRALEDFSRELPLEAAEDIQTTEGSREIDISSLPDRIMVEAAEYPIGAYPPSYRRFALWGDTLTILSDAAPDGGDARIYYGKLHTLDAETSTVPPRYEALVASGAAAYAMIEWASYAVNRVNVGGAGTPDAYREQAAGRLDRFHAELKRLGRKNRVRARQLYAPATTPVSKSTVAGP